MNHETIPQNLLYHRRRKGWTQEELADRTPVTLRTIQRIENGHVRPHLKTVRLLAEGLSITVEDLTAEPVTGADTGNSNRLLLLHAAPLIGSFIPPCHLLLPLLGWWYKRGEDPAYDVHGRLVLNFQLTASIGLLLGVLVLMLSRFGFLVFGSAVAAYYTIMLYNIWRISKGRPASYPPVIPFFGPGEAAGGSRLTLLMIPCLFGPAILPGQSQVIQRLDGSEITPKALTTQVERLVEAAGVHGLSLTVFNHDSIVYQHNFGYGNYPAGEPFRAGTSFYGASLSKAVFSVLVMQLVEEGVIDLDTPLESYLPRKIYEYEPETRWHDNFADLREDSLYHLITARMCLSHTSGFPNWRWFEPDKKLRVKFEPGSRYFYSGEGMTYLQVVIEKLLQQNLQELAEERIFRPLQMDRSAYLWQQAFEDDFAYGHRADGSTYKKDTDNEPRGASTLETTPADYARFLQAVLQQQLLSPAAWKELFTPQIRIRSRRHFGPLALSETDQHDDIQLSCGLGWGVLQSPYGKGVFKGGNGSGFQHYSILFPETGKGVLIMTNSDNGESIYRDLLRISLQDVYTPWQWAGYVPWDAR